jgi:3-hydroxyisobutyrate dehydrogenase-like beta-hydroxyacid dehydrogenase
VASCVGLLHPGAMGATVGAAVRAGGARVLFASEGRSAASVARAHEAKLADVGTVAELASRADVILSVCPPHAALDVARQVAALGYAGLYVDANAIAPGTAQAVAETVTAAGADFVDGALIGPPATAPARTRLYLSGPHAKRVASLFAQTYIEPHVLESEALTGASALKMVYAGYTKGTTALIAALLATADAHGVGDALRAEWGRSHPDVLQRVGRAVPASAAKAWRFASEMSEIAATLAEAGLPAGFHEAASEVYARLSPFKDASPPPSIAAVIAALLAGAD